MDYHNTTNAGDTSLAGSTGAAPTNQQRIGQWIACCIVGLITFSVLGRFSAPGATTGQVLFALLFGAALTYIMLPRVFFGLPSAGKWTAYGAILVLIALIPSAGAGDSSPTAASGTAASQPADTDKSCKGLVPAVIALAQKGDGPEIIEINDVQTWGPSTCRGSAETTRGTAVIEYGTETTAQGTELVTLRYPNGF